MVGTHRWWGVAAALAGLAACEAPGAHLRRGQDRDGVVSLRADPAVLDFGSASALEGESIRSQVRFTNDGTSVVALGAAWLSDDEAFVWDDELPLALAPGEDFVTEVEFVPADDALHTGALHLATAAGSELAVGLVAVSTAPVLVVSVDLPSTASVGCSLSGLLTIQNRGSDPVHLQGVTVDGGWTVDTANLRPVLDPGTETQVPVYASTDASGLWEGTLVVSTAELEPQSLPLELEVFAEDPTELRFDYHPPSRADIVLLVDDHASMVDALLAAQDNMPVWLDRLGIDAVDARIAVLPGSIDLCDAAWIDLSDTTQSLAAFLRERLVGSTADHATASALLPKALAAVDAMGPEECLGAFRRSDSDLHLIFLSGWADDTVDVSDWSDELRSKTLGHTVVVDGILPTNSTDCPSLGGSASLQGVVATFQGWTGNLCGDTPERLWQDLADAIHAWARGTVVVPLARPPLDGLIDIRGPVGPLSSYAYNTTTQSIEIPYQADVPFGAELSATYTPLALCP